MMSTHDSEARQHFLNSDDRESSDASVELPELTKRGSLAENINDDDDVSDPRSPSSPFGHEDEPKQCRELPHSPKKSAIYSIIFMLGAQVFSASMNVSIRLLENAATHLHPLQILFVRMGVTALCITLWLLRENKPDSILGHKENRRLLFVRAIGGFLGVFGLYYSLRYLNLSEATVITFMMPLVASFGGYLLLGSPFSWLEILLSIVSLFGVFLVASPDVVLSGNASQMDPRVDESKVVSLTMRVWAICVGLLGVCGSAAAFLCMSAIGKSERPLTVVNFFATLCTLFSCFGLLVVPGLKFEMPGDAWEWILLALSGISGFLMQLLITMSLQAAKSLVAVNMVYTQIAFALVLDGVVFHTIPHTVSLLGCALICGSALFLAWYKTKNKSKMSSPEDGNWR